MKISTLTKKTLAVFALAAFAVSSLGLQANLKVANAATDWDTTGSYVFDMDYEGTDYAHNVNLVQDLSDNLTGNGNSGAYTWVITSGSVVNDTISFVANYTATPDAVTPQTVLEVDGTIAGDGTISGTWADNYNGGERSGTFTTSSGEALDTTPVEGEYVTTKPATNVTASDATLNGRNEGSVALGHSFWASTSTFSTESSTIPSGVYSTPDLGPIAAETDFSALLSSVTGLPAITPSTTYYYAAWTNVEGTWHPGEVRSFTTDATDVDPDPETSTVTILKYVDAAHATATSADNTDFTMNASWDAENIGAGSGQFVLSEDGYNEGPAYEAETAEMTNGADYSVSEVIDENTGLACSEEKPFVLRGYSHGTSVAAAMAMAPTMTAPNLENITSDHYIIVWNDDCSTPDNDGTLDGDVVDGEGVLEVTSIDVLDSSAVANGDFEDGWKYAFNITVPTDETDVSMKFDNWIKTGDPTETIPAANNMRISSVQADSDATIMITAADTYSTPPLHINEDLDPTEDGYQIRVILEVRVPAGTENGSYTTNYGVMSNED